MALKKIQIIAVIVAFVTVSGIALAAEDLSGYSGTVYFADDYESGYQYLGSGNAHPGGGYYSSLGGNITGPEGTGCSDNNTYHNTIISSDAAAGSAVTSSVYALKTPYDGDCNNESYSRDTTIITIPTIYEIYIRWYQKWTGNWNNANAASPRQHKFTKIYNGGFGGSLGLHFSFAGGYNSWKNFMPNVGGQFDKDGYTVADWCWVHQTDSSGPDYNGDLDTYDDINNQQGPGGIDAETDFQTDTWYCIELHAKINSDADTADGIVQAWIDGVLVYQTDNIKFYPNVDRSAKFGVNLVELQHIYATRATNDDQPTYMDNLVIGSSYIGPIGETGSTATNMGTPTGVMLMNSN